MSEIDLLWAFKDFIDPIFGGVFSVRALLFDLNEVELSSSLFFISKLILNFSIFFYLNWSNSSILLLCWVDYLNIIGFGVEGLYGLYYLYPYDSLWECTTYELSGGL